MQAFTHFSQHAFQRISERVRLRSEDIMRMLDAKITVNTGRKPGFNRDHLLFYSELDNDFFVAIQDSLTGTVVTVLPLDYHTNLAWKITQQQCQLAKQRWLEFKNSLPEYPAPEKLASKFLVNALYLNEEGAPKAKLLQKVPAEPYQHSTIKLVKDLLKPTEIARLAHDKGIEPEIIYGVSIRLGNDGCPMFFDLAA